ncbi:MAG: glycoside hydrolase family 2 protein, partial [Firmicutes bacterium]|nr:glycoside hydrolase family 2 protein [Bacillota bacterium]
MVSICGGWEFSGPWSEEFLSGEGTYPVVDLPHNVKEISLHYASPSDYEGIYGYRRVIECGSELAGKRVFLQLDGAAHIAQVFLNGEFLSEHRCGYTSFRTELTGHLKEGSNVLAVRLDSTENKEVPPFGFVIDYLTYSGLYREAWLDIRGQSFIDDVFVSTPDLKTVHAAVKTEGEASECRLTVLDGNKEIASASGKPGDLTISCADVQSWHVDHPKLYTLRTELFNKDGSLLDAREDNFGFRTAVFKADGFYLNGEKLYIRGLNRHQNYPYIGYAATKSLQEEDARILKEELCCNAVRTSHYPQSQWFLDACDRLGLLVFTEIPGWQHI